MGITERSLWVTYNLEKLERFNKERSTVFIAGKYICINWVTPENKPNLMFLDLRKNPEMAKQLVNSPDFSTILKTRLIALIETHNSVYDSIPDSVELVEGKSPVKCKRL